MGLFIEIEESEMVLVSSLDIFTLRFFIYNSRDFKLSSKSAGYSALDIKLKRTIVMQIVFMHFT